MPIENKPFVKYNLDDEIKVDSFTMRFNKEERTRFEADKLILKQKKDSTAMKQLASLGSIVIHDPKMKRNLEIILGNSRRNKRSGIADFD